MSLIQNPPMLVPNPSHNNDPSLSKRLFRPYSCPDHHVTKGRYITSNDPRGYIPVYEYPLNGQWIMMDMDDGFVLWTGIWKALGHSKADIVKMIESEPELAARIRRVRGGYLKIQGTWMPYEVALRLSRRVAWHIRYDLVPLFGPTFPSTCLTPEQPGFGQLISGDTRRRRARRVPLPSQSSASRNWTVISTPMPSAQHFSYPDSGSRRSAEKHHPERRSSLENHIPGPSYSPTVARASSSHDRNQRSIPYEPSYRRHGSFADPHHHVYSSSRGAPEFSLEPSRPEFALPPVQRHPSHLPITLPSIADLVGISNDNSCDPASTVLKRLRSDEDENPRRRNLPDYRLCSSAEFTSALSPFCPLPEGTRAHGMNWLPTLAVEDSSHDHPYPSPTFTGSTATGDLSPSTPDPGDDVSHVLQSPFVHDPDQWSGRPESSFVGPAVEAAGGSPSKSKPKPSNPSNTESLPKPSDDDSTPRPDRMQGRLSRNPVTRPHRPW